MKKATAGVFFALFCFVMLAFFAISVTATESGTVVSIIFEDISIISQTEDCTIEVGDDLELMITTTRTNCTYNWEVSTNGGTAWTPIATTSTYTISDAQANTPENLPYQYRVTVTSVSGLTDSTIIKVLVSNDYDYRTISLRNGDTEVTSYMHDKTRLVVTRLPENTAAAAVLEAKLSEGCVPLFIYDVSLINQNNEVVPYFGKLKVDFHVGSRYDALTLTAYHLKDGNIFTYSNVVDEGVLSIIVDSLSPFMIEVPATDTRTVTVNYSAGGSVIPSGNVNITDGSDKTFTFLPNAGYKVSAVTVDGETVEFTGNSCTLENITQDHTVFVSFEFVAPSDILHTVTINAPAHGHVYPSGEINVRHGSAQTIYFYPASGHELDTVTINGVAVNVVGNSYTISAVTSNTNVVVNFREGGSQPPDVYMTIAASAGANGSISPMGYVYVEYGGDMYFYFIPDEGYEVDEVIIDDVSTDLDENLYHFVNVVGYHSINVTFKPVPPPTVYHTINASSGENGSISPSGDVQVADGGALTFSFIADENYEIDTVTIDGTETAVSDSAYTFTEVISNHTIHVTFKEIVIIPPVTNYIITASSGENGSISPSGDVEVADGDSATFSFIADENYEIDTVTIDGTETAVSGSAYTFAAVTSNHTIHVTFKEIVIIPPVTNYIITASSGENGSINPSGDVEVADGDSATFAFIADENYEIDTVTIDGTETAVSGSAYTFTEVTSNHTIHVTFKEIVITPPVDYYTITASSGVNGSISPSGDVQVADGDFQIFVFIPDKGYDVHTVTVDGTIVSESGYFYIFTNVTENHTIRVRFKPRITPPTPTNFYTITASSGANGTINPSGSVEIEENGSQTFVFTPDKNYEIDTVTVDGTMVSVSDNFYSFTNVNANHTIHVAFKRNAMPPPMIFHSITASSGSNGSISPSGEVWVMSCASQTLYFIPDAGYEVDTVIIDGSPTAVYGGSYTFSDIAANHTVYVQFRQSVTPPPPVKYYTITASTGENGGISPTGSIEIAENGFQCFVFTPDKDYEIDTVTVDGAEVKASDDAYSFTQIDADHTIHVQFKKIDIPEPMSTDFYTVTASSGENGAVSPSGDIQAVRDSSQTINFIPDDGYEVDTVTVDGAAQSVSGSSYSFDRVTSNHTIAVTFKKSETPPEPIEHYTITAGSGSNGSISPEGDVQIIAGRDTYCYFLPDDGYEVDVVTVDGTAVKTENNFYSFKTVDADHTIHVSFKEIPSVPVENSYHPVSIINDGNGSISPSGDVIVADGGSQTFYLIADDDYEVESIYVNGEKQDVAGGQFTVDNIDEDIELRVTFKSLSSPMTSGASPCFICELVGRNIAPQCWLLPLTIVSALVGTLWLSLRRRYAKKRK